MSVWMRTVVLGISFLMVMTSQVWGQAKELTSADRLALLYTSQLSFDSSGAPVVKVGIADGVDSFRFVPSEPMTVLPTGPGGPELVLPEGKSYQVRIEEGVAGSYRHFVVVARMRPNETEAISEQESLWSARGVTLEKLERGSLFAFSGTMFDSREVVLVSGPFATREEVEAERERLASLGDEPLSVHSELDKLPTGLLVLEGAGEGIELRHHDVMWIKLGAGVAEVEDVLTESGKKRDREYAGGLIFSPDREGKLSLVNEVSVETVLRGVVPSEIYATAPSESLKVQAIAARGTLLSQVGSRHEADPYNLCDEQHCQVFGGMNSSKKSTDKAVLETRGQVLFDGKRIAETYYSSNNGGLSATPEEVWGLPPRGYLKARDDDAVAQTFDAPPTEEELRSRLEEKPESWSNTDSFSSGKHFRWEKSFSGKELDALVAKKYPEVGQVLDLVVEERGPGGRVVRLQIVGSDGEAIVERELPTRRLFGGLKSGLFVLDISRGSDDEPERFTFIGGGFGHGVGMSQTGAMGMAEAGHTYVEILDHYYHGAEVKTLW